MMNNEKKEGGTKRSIKLRRLKLVQYWMQLTITKNENFSKTQATLFCKITVLTRFVTLSCASCLNA